MAVQAKCPGCGKVFQADDKFAGKTAKCPNCKSSIRLPEATTSITTSPELNLDDFEEFLNVERGPRRQPPTPPPPLLPQTSESEPHRNSYADSLMKSARTSLDYEREHDEWQERLANRRKPQPIRSLLSSLVMLCLASIALAVVWNLNARFDADKAQQEKLADKDTASPAASDASPAPAEDAPSYSLEFKLSVIDDRPGDQLVMNRFRSLLPQLDASYVETPMQIADMTAKAQEILRNEGISVSLLDMMEGMNTIWPMPTPNQEYSHFLALYIAARQKGYSHEKAIATLVDFVYGLLHVGTSESEVVTPTKSSKEHFLETMQELHPEEEELSFERMQELAQDPFPRWFMTDEQTRIKLLEKEIHLQVLFLWTVHELDLDSRELEKESRNALLKLQRAIDSHTRLMLAYIAKHRSNPKVLALKKMYTLSGAVEEIRKHVAESGHSTTHLELPVEMNR